MHITVCSGLFITKKKTVSPSALPTDSFLVPSLVLKVLDLRKLPQLVVRFEDAGVV